MYIEVRATNGKDLSKRGMISFYFEGKRYRFYNGKHLGLEINPNRQLTHKLKSASLEQLKFKTIEALNDGWNPKTGVYNFKKIGKGVVLRFFVDFKLTYFSLFFNVS